jgi:hypothetical protein
MADLRICRRAGVDGKVDVAGCGFRGGDQVGNRLPGRCRIDDKDIAGGLSDNADDFKIVIGKIDHVRSDAGPQAEVCQQHRISVGLALIVNICRAD